MLRVYLEFRARRSDRWLPQIREAGMVLLMLSKEEVLKIAQLARLELSPEEVVFFQNRLGRVLDYMKELNGVKLEAAATVRHVPEDAEPFREDVVEEAFDREAIMRNAPALDEGGFSLPAILESE
ncbi:Asp-tRNA(Asn)/Glu-tRNA(Gln) amidotransferase subunit GatC [bacterium]|nr:Asp-tRNA(Asn)/Glu-tRNA(Gln) amidotransferase subunit GatC [bacterium]NBW98250.1 Asp-tRNA(Asn)/Glu-tRNA(Gln) amidotransferase subunit GatC [bacterium]NBX82761.1 Asp-tRNA(Asn)/Glu-tRNA(Gln) amidotransferase subunit GatC [bacterium]